MRIGWTKRKRWVDQTPVLGGPNARIGGPNARIWWTKRRRLVHQKTSEDMKCGANGLRTKAFEHPIELLVPLLLLAAAPKRETFDPLQRG